MHRASPTLLTIAACLAVSLVAAAPATAEDSATPDPVPPPVLLTPTPDPDPAPTPSAPTDAESTPAPLSSTDVDSEEPDPVSTNGDVLLSVNVVMAGTAAGDAPSLTPPRTRLPLRLGHYGSKVSVLQDRLSWLGYAIRPSNTEYEAFGESTKSAVKRFQAKNWLTPTGKVDEKTWRLLRTQAEPVGILPLRCTEVKAALCIDKTSRTLRYVERGKVKLVTDARFGAPGMETDEGIFQVREKSFNHVSSIYHTWMPRAMFFNGDEAVHYSPDFNAVGYLHGSHGCVGIRDIDVATRLFNKVDVGTRVYVYWS